MSSCRVLLLLLLAACLHLFVMGQPPTDLPSPHPSWQPSGEPSARPTRHPTGQPTNRPSTRPTSQPSREPTSNPTAPSGQPSGQPSLQPTGQPTTPTGQPTNRPSGNPTRVPRPGSVDTSKFPPWLVQVGVGVGALLVVTAALWRCFTYQRTAAARPSGWNPCRRRADHSLDACISDEQLKKKEALFAHHHGGRRPRVASYLPSAEEKDNL